MAVISASGTQYHRHQTWVIAPHVLIDQSNQNYPALRPPNAFIARSIGCDAASGVADWAPATSSPQNADDDHSVAVGRRIVRRLSSFGSGGIMSLCVAAENGIPINGSRHLSGILRGCALRVSGKPIETFAVLAAQDSFVAGKADRGEYDSRRRVRRDRSKLMTNREPSFPGLLLLRYGERREHCTVADF